MGKKSKEPNHETSDSIKSLFSDSNPFRRKPEPQPQPAAEELGLAVDDGAAADAKKRKRMEKLVDPNPSPSAASSTPESIPKKRKKAENNEGEDENLKSRKKNRKRDDVIAEYEKRRFGEIDEKEEVDVHVGEKRKVKDVASLEMAEEEDEGFDDESKLLRTVFVGNLPLKIKKKVLVKEFEGYGEIESVRIRSVPIVDSKKPRKGAIIQGKINEDIGRVNAYIVFSNEQSAHAALSHNMSMIGENHIRVDMACPPRKKLKGDTQLYERKKTVFVGNLPFDVKDEELYQLFCGVNKSGSNVEAIRVIRDPQTSLGKGIAYILFKTRDAANKVVRGSELKIGDRALRVCHAKRESDTPTSKKKDYESKRDFRRKKFAAISNEKSSEKNNDKLKPSAASLSYQGLRSSKSGVVKKSGLHSRPSVYEKHGTKRTGGGIESKDQKGKRPAVAARKAKQLKKRKLENGTSENTHRNKKMRRQ